MNYIDVSRARQNVSNCNLLSNKTVISKSRKRRNRRKKRHPSKIQNTNKSILCTEALRAKKEPSLSRKLLINGFCDGTLHVNICKTIDLYLRPISKATERAIASAHFVASVVDQYQNDINNQCPYSSCNKKHGDTIDLKQYIYIRGGALRDTILTRDINDIDIVIDICTLTKVYHHHLIKYHSKINEQSIDCGCFLWQRYLNMYRHNPATNDKLFADIIEEGNQIKKLEKNMVRCDFLLNARFFKDLILKCSLNKARVIRAINTWGYTNWVLNIDQSLIYKGIDLKGARFDIGDEMSNSNGTKPNFRKCIVNENQGVFQTFKWNECFEYLRVLKKDMNGAHYNANLFKCIKRNYDIVLHKSVFVCNNQSHVTNGINETMTVHLPLYSFRMKYSHQFCDFTINGIRFPLSAIYDATTMNPCIDFNWYSKIFKYSNANDGSKPHEIVFKKHNRMALHDIQNKTIRQPHLHILTTEYMYDDYFWRFVKILCKFATYIGDNGSWKIDHKTLTDMRYCHGVHFRQLSDARMKEFINRLLFWNVNESNFKSVLRLRLKVFKMIGIEDALKAAFKIHKKFHEYLQSATDKRFDDKKKKCTCNMLRSFGYKV